MSDPVWLHGHPHDPNPAPPSTDATITLRVPSGDENTLAVDDLRALPTTTARGCYIVSTGHGTSGPFDFAGVHLRDLLAAHNLLDGSSQSAWQHVDVISADGFGNRVQRAELAADTTGEPTLVLLAHTLDGAPMPRTEGLVRLIVPSETDDALRQVKWIARIEVG